jgi:hypothetical protein
MASSALTTIIFSTTRLHFGCVRSWRLNEDVLQFDVELGMLKGLLAPVIASLRLDTRAVKTWDEAVAADLRQKWVKNFWLLEQLHGLGFQRAKG